MDFKYYIIERTKDWTIFKKGKNIRVAFNDIKRCANKDGLELKDSYIDLKQREQSIIKYAKILDKIYRSGGFKIHGCGIKIRHGGYLFVGPSGAGKTTISRLANREKKILNDDEIIISKDRLGFTMLIVKQQKKFSPHLAIECCRLKRVYFLKKSFQNKAILIKQRDAFLNIIKHSKWKFTRNVSDGKIFLKVCAELTKMTPCYILEFLPSPSIWRYLDNAHSCKGI